MYRKPILLLALCFSLGMIASTVFPGFARKSSAQVAFAYMQPVTLGQTCESPYFPYEFGAFSVKSTGAHPSPPPEVNVIRVFVTWSFTEAPGQPVSTLTTADDVFLEEEVRLSDCGISNTLNLISAAITSACWVDNSTDGCIDPALMPVTDDQLLLVGGPVNQCRAAPCSSLSSPGTGCVLDDGDAFDGAPPVGRAERGNVTLRRKRQCQNCPPPTDLVFDAFWIVNKGGVITSHAACRKDDPTQCGRITMLSTEKNLVFKTFTAPVIPGTGCQAPVDDLVTLCISPFGDTGAALKSQLNKMTAKRSFPTPCP